MKRLSFLLLLGLCGPVVAPADVVLPRDFSATQGAGGIHYEAVGDDRAGNVQNPGPPGAVAMEFLGDHDLPHGSATFSGPLYAAPDFYPYVLHDADLDALLLHPGTGGDDLGSLTSNLGASVRIEASISGLYRVVGAFARANDFVDAGNGVDVLVSRDGGTAASVGSEVALLQAAIGAGHAVDPLDPFAGTGVVAFDFLVHLAAGESIRFTVFSDSQGQDGTFDITALRVGLAIVPEPSSAALALLGVLAAPALALRSRQGRPARRS